ncbi:MAG: hypothetical protein RDU89_10575 [bacterium]|nr:hypothetical protein [bacterium]
MRKLMTLKKESRTYHVRWEWELGDGRRVVDEDASSLVSTLTPTYDSPGTYVVRAISFSNQGQILREQRWNVTLAPGVEAGPALRSETLSEPRVVLAVEGPAAWVVGRPARFTVRAWTEDPRFGKIVEVKADPGWAFEVVWESPGTYAVAAAVSVKVNYTLGGRSITITNTYLRGVKVDVGVATVSR